MKGENLAANKSQKMKGTQPFMITIVASFAEKVNLNSL